MIINSPHRIASGGCRRCGSSRSTTGGPSRRPGCGVAAAGDVADSIAKCARPKLQEYTEINDQLALPSASNQSVVGQPEGQRRGRAHLD